MSYNVVHNMNAPLTYIISLLLLVMAGCTTQKVSDSKLQVDKSMELKVQSLIDQQEFSDKTGLFFKMSDQINPNIKHGSGILELVLFAQENEKYIPSTCNCQLKNDTLKITGGFGYNVGVYFVFDYTNKINSGQFYLHEESKVFSKSINGGGTKELLVKLTPSQITFSQEPDLKIDNIIYGKVIGNTDPFGEKSSDVWVERRIELEAIFKCKIVSHGPL